MKTNPALIIGTIGTIVLGAIATLAGQGLISDTLAGKATDIVQALQQLLVLLVPLITAVVIRGQVYSPATVEALTGGTPVEVIDAAQDAGDFGDAIPAAAPVADPSPAKAKRTTIKRKR